MTTIILVAIGVVIAAAAALMMIYYGGNAFGVNEVRAEAGRLVNEGAQVQYATDLFYRERGEMPGATTNGATGMQELIDEKYLTHNPQGAVNPDGSVEKWKLEYGTDGMIYSKLGTISSQRSLDVCREARRQLKYEDVVPTGQPYAGQIAIYKCDGSDYPRSHPTGTLPDREPCCIR